MKAYHMKRKDEFDAKVVVRIVNGNEVVKDKDGAILEKIGGPIGGSNILPLAVGEKDRFVPFMLDDGVTEIRTEAEARKAYDAMYSVTSGQMTTNPPPEEPEGKGEDEDDDEDETPSPKKRGRPRKNDEEDVE